MKSKHKTIKVYEDDYARFDRFAKAQGMTKSGAFKRFIRDHISNVDRAYRHARKVTSDPTPTALAATG